MHEYLSLYNFSYGQCSECKKRTPPIYLVCHYCYSCQDNDNNMLNLQNRQGAQKIGLAIRI